MKVIDGFHKGLNVFLRWFCIVLFVVMVALVVAQVIVRFLGISLPWTEVSARIVFIWQGIIGAAYVIGEKDDVAIDWLVNKLPVKAVKSISILAHVIVAFFAVWIMIWGGMRNVLAGWEDNVQLMPVTQGQTFLVLPIAGALIVIYSLLHIIDIVRASDEEITHHELPEDFSKIAEEGI